MAVLVLDGKRIIRMTWEGIAYLDEEAFEQVIYFSECYENYLKPRLDVTAWERHKALNPQDNSCFDDYVEKQKSYKQVALRDIDDLFIEFHTEPRVRFTFANRDEWWKLRKHIEESGWRTFDLT